jgi:hypothetical protein
MSEYQYYEFAAIDKALTPKQMAELRSRSSRASITPTSFVNDYQWGDLKADPRDWMERYFDAHVYVANWCSCWLYLRLPRDVLDPKTVRAFKTESAFIFGRTDRQWLLEWGLSESENYDRFAEDDGRGWMSRLTPLRDELLRGDLRPLYLGWLAGVSAGEVDETAIEPSPPPGLSQLTAAQQSLAEFLDISRDLVVAAGLPDQQVPGADSQGDAEVDIWIAELPATEKAAMLRLLLTGSAQRAERMLKSRFLVWQRGRRRGGSELPRRTVAELQESARSVAEARKKREAVLHKKAQAEQRAQRETYLRSLATDFDRHWRHIDTHAARGVASAYDQVKRSLVDLADAYALCESRANFERRLAQFMQRHGQRMALVRRLAEAGLWKKSQR